MMAVYRSRSDVGGVLHDRRMTSHAAALRADLDALAEALASALPAFDTAVERARGEAAGRSADTAEGAENSASGVARSAADDDLEFGRMSGSGLMRVVEAASRLRRRVDAVLVRVSDEIATRSAPAFGADGLSKQHGFASPARLVAAATGGSTAEASRLISVGAATRTRQSFAGEPLPPKRPHARGAIDHGALSLDAAPMITGMLERVAPRADAQLLDPYEATLVAMAEHTPLSIVTRAVTLAESRLDADGVEPADNALHDSRSLTFHEDGAGVFHLRGRFDPITAAPIKAALDALVSDALHRREQSAGAVSGPASSAATLISASAPAMSVPNAVEAVAAGAASARLAQQAADVGHAGAAADSSLAGAAPVIEDRRTIPQLQADALADLARHALGCADAPTTLPTTTVIVRLPLDALRDGGGTAEIDGIDRPVAAATARRLAADAELIPVVLGTDSVPLDLGRSARLFTRSQRLALGERDGGCASCGRNITYAQAHHIEWWQRDGGRTDLSNGVLLCSHCHHQVHRDGWRIDATPTEVWFTPPPHIDSAQRPRQGGRARFDPARWRSTQPPHRPPAPRGPDQTSALSPPPPPDQRAPRARDSARQIA